MHALVGVGLGEAVAVAAGVVVPPEPQPAISAAVASNAKGIAASLFTGGQYAIDLRVLCEGANSTPSWEDEEREPGRRTRRTVTTNRLRAAALVLMLIVLSVPSRARAGDLVSSYAAVHPTLAFIVCGASHGSGFVVASTPSGSLIVTAQHVIAKAKKIDVYVNDDPHVAVEATLVKADAEHDLALIRIHRGGLATAKIGTDTPATGSEIALAGYPPASIDFLNAQNDLKPELQSGRITAVRISGAFIQHSAPSEAGESGGPLFLADSGDVIGVVKGKYAGGAGYFAVGSAALRAFLQSANVSFDSGESTVNAPAPSAGARTKNALVLEDVPGARRFCAVRSRAGTFKQPANSKVQVNFDYGTPVENAVMTRMHTLFASDVNLNGDDPFRVVSPPPAAVAQFARANNCVGVIRIGESWNVENAGLGSTISATVLVQLFDFRGNLWISEPRSKQNRRFFAYAPNDLQAVLNDLGTQAADAVVEPMSGKDESAATNFARYGIPLVNGAKRAFFALSPVNGMATVSFAVPMGSAAQAGLQPGDTVVSVNGTRTNGLDQAHLTELLAKTPNWDIVVHGADGRDVHVRFEAEDIRWYLQHPVKVQSQ